MRIVNIILFFLVITSHFSCDVSKRCLINNKEVYHITTDCGDIALSVFKLQRRYFLHQEFSDGEFTICIDSLKTALLSDKVDIYELKWSGQIKKTDQNTDSCFVIKGGFIATSSFFLNIKKDIGLNSFSQKDLLRILPCNYIMCNGEPVIRDTIEVDLGIQITPGGQIKF